EVARGDARDGVAVLIGAVEIAVIDEIDRAAEYPDPPGWEVRAQHVAATCDERGAVQREFVVRERREPGGIPERRFASARRSGRGLPHPHGLRADGEHEKKSAGVEGRLLSGQAVGWAGGHKDDKGEQSP